MKVGFLISRKLNKWVIQPSSKVHVMDATGDLMDKLELRPSGRSRAGASQNAPPTGSGLFLGVTVGIQMEQL